MDHFPSGRLVYFLSGARKGHVRKNGDVLRYNRRTNELAIGAPNGTIRTLFRPGVSSGSKMNGIDYWQSMLKQ